MYSVTVYKNTGFNMSNVPDSPTLLNNFANIQVPAIDTLQQRFLTRIRVKATWDAVKDCDYCRIDDFFYSIGNIRMTSGDVAELSLIPDFLLSAGGAEKLDFLDGITERVHVSRSDDTFGAFTDDDILTQPVEPLVMVQNSIYPWSNNQSDKQNKHMTLIESTIDLHIYEEDPDLNKAITYKSENVTGELVTVPYMKTIPYSTDYQYGGKRGTCTYRLDGLGTDGTTESPQIQDGMKRARGLGMESAIIAQYNVPLAFVSQNSPVTVFNTDKRAFSSLGGMINEYSSDIAYQQAGTYKNMRVTYGAYTPYGLITCAGNRGEWKAEDIFEDGKTSPTVSCHPDIRSDGKPYWRFLNFHGSGGSFWQNCLAGADWANVPLVYNEKSGNVLNRQIFEAQRDIAREGLKWARIGNAARTANNAMNDIPFGELGNLKGLTGSGTREIWGDAYTKYAGGTIAATFGAAAGDIASGVVTDYAIRSMYNKGEIAAVTSFLASNEVVAPEIQIPYNTNIMRELYDNGVVVYRYIYSDNDLKRIDRLLTMYGYRVTKALEGNDFKTREKFNFVQAEGVTVCGKGGERLPKWWNDGIAAQLAGGVRVWHTVPTAAAYDNNP